MDELRAGVLGLLEAAVAAQAAEAAGGDVALKQKYGALNMTVAGKMVIRFKKFRGRRLRTSGISTRTRNMFLRQEEVLDGMVVTHLVVGYLLDDLEVATEKISMTCPLGGDNLWQLDLGTTTGGSEDGQGQAEQDADG